MDNLFYLWLLANLILYRSITFRNSLIINPTGLFLYLNSLIFGGSIYYSSLNGTENYFQFLSYIGIGQTTFILGAFLVKLLNNDKLIDLEYKYGQARIIDDIKGVNLVFISIAILISLAVTYLSVSAQGGLVPLLAISALSSGLDEAGRVYMDSRINISAGKEYFAPGYVAQFKDYILPVTTLMLYIKYRVTPSRSLLAIVVALVIISILALMSVGTRSGVVIFAGASLLILSSTHFGKLAIARTTVIASGLIIVLLMSALTILMGRSGDEGFTAENVILVAPTKVAERVALITAKENVKIYDKLLRNSESQWGGEWLLGLSTVLPGRQVPMSIYLAKLVGYSRGNVPFHPWASYYYNFSYLGILVAGLWGMTIQAFYYFILRLPKRITTSVGLLYTGVLTAFAIDPIGLLLYGSFITAAYTLFFLGIRTFVYLASKLNHETR